jgi:diguanylate cyclase (GGDEF)-like protein
MHQGPVIADTISSSRTQLHAELLAGPNVRLCLPLAELNAVTELVKQKFASDMSAFSMLDREWQWLTARCGIDGDRLPREHSFCGRVVDTNEAVVVPDTRLDPAYCDHPLVIGAPHVAAYIGVPVIVHGEDGTDILAGSLCAVFYKPRSFSEADIIELGKLAAIAAALVGSRLTAMELANLALEHQNDLHRLGRLHRQLGQAERIAGIGSWRLDLADNHVHWSEQVYAIYDLPVAQTPPLEEAMSFYPDRSRVILADAIALAIEQGRAFDEEADFISATGKLKRVRCMGELELHDGKPVAIIGVFQDITARYEMEQALRRSATTDELTGLTNRAGFNRALSQTIMGARRDAQTFALLLIDLDGFKAVNDRLGHLKGDQVLQTIAMVLKSPYLAGQVCARLGGDEFAIIVQGKDEAAMSSLTETLRQDLRHCVDVADGTWLTVSGTIGVSWFEPLLTGRDMLRRADTALYHGKRKQRGTVTTYCAAIEHSICYEQ